MAQNNMDLVKELQDYENKWVALKDPDMKVVGSGDTVAEARKEAKEKGFNQIILYKVMPFDKGYCSYAR